MVRKVGEFGPKSCRNAFKEAEMGLKWHKEVEEVVKKD